MLGGLESICGIYNQRNKEPPQRMAGTSFKVESVGSFLLCMILGIAGSDTGSSQCFDGSCPSDLLERQPLECHTYMAPSTLGDETNMGIYTGVDLKNDDVVHWPEIAIPLLFREWGEHPEGFKDGNIWERYIWEGYTVDHETYDETDTAASKGLFLLLVLGGRKETL